MKGLSLDQDLDVSSIARTVEEDDVPLFAMRVVVERLQTGDKHGSDCVRWTGTVFLEARAEDNAMNVVAFLHDWKDQLPESWGRHATLETLKGNFTQPSDDTIVFARNGLNAGKDPSSATTAKFTGPQARRWHEKFKGSRR
ncbi:MAG: hypothetical protein Q9198_003563 [Flavoplaca austrocitrina]